MVQMKLTPIDNPPGVILKLYIPHGSDETPASNFRKDLAFGFISHMVQMKPEVGLGRR